MSGDYTRFTHDPLKRRSGVLMQQGRVQLDADWNEFVDITMRRQTLQSLDTFGGPIGVPRLTTPDAFLVGVADGPPQDLTIGPGRLYVDGHLAELFETDGATYRAQPFLPDPPALPAGDAVVYLDLWEREVTFIDDRSLLDVALGGADTATRLQTAWQVRIEGRDGAACGMPVGEPPSAGRLTTEAISPPAPDDPCLLPPAAGYRGLENRLYRVEIHDPGALGTARFKWSRENGSIVSAVRGLSIAGAETTLNVKRIGRDPVLRFRIDDWVTVTDDHRELMGEPGEMARIIDIVEARNEIVLDRALSGGRPFGADADGLQRRHTRVQRWDQTADINPIDGDGLIATAAGPIQLEDGIRVFFETVPAGGSFRVGDYWVFAARVADASVETLDRAPPRGVIHHYAQLAAVTGLGGPAPSVTDCRPAPEAEACCCTVVVAPGGDIQEAIDSLPPEGGCVCLKPGVHQPAAPLTVGRGNVRITGESPGVRVEGLHGGPVLIIGNPAGFPVSGIRVETVGFHGVGERGSGVIIVAGAADVRIADCSIEGRDAWRLVGIDVVDADEVRIVDCAIRSVQIGIRLSGSCEFPVIAGNSMTFDMREQAELSIGVLAQRRFVGVAEVTGNVIEGAVFGIILNEGFPLGPRASLAIASRVSDNLLALRGAPIIEGDAERLVGIDVAADYCGIAGNRIGLQSPGYIGIHATGSETIIAENTIVSNVREAPAPLLSIGIQVGTSGDAEATPTMEVVVADNVLEGPMHGIIAVEARNVAIHDNVVVGGPARQGSGVALWNARNTAVTGNRIEFTAIGLFSQAGRANRLAANDLSSCQAGIIVAEEAEPIVASNRVHDMAQFGAVGLMLIGRADFIENRLAACGYDGPVGVGLAALLTVGELHLHGNEVLNTGMTPANELRPERAIGILGLLVLEGRVEGNLVSHTDALERDPQREDRALLMGGLFEMQVTLGNTMAVFGFPVQIEGNKFVGTGRRALVELVEQRIQDRSWMRFERVFFNGNYCMHRSGDPDDRHATVELVGRAAVVANNQIKATTPRFFSVDFSGMAGPFVGNVTTGGTLQHADFPSPANSFNLIL